MLSGKRYFTVKVWRQHFAVSCATSLVPRSLLVARNSNGRASSRLRWLRSCACYLVLTFKVALAVNVATLHVQKLNS
jgi:hypothetical protein